MGHRTTPSRVLKTDEWPSSDSSLCPLAYTPDSRRLAVAGAEEVGFLSADSRTESKLFPTGVSEVWGLAFPADGMLGAAGGAEGRVAVWDLA